MAKRRSSMTIYNAQGRVVATLSFRKECTPEIWMKKGWTYKVGSEES
jgi:hypothetical protein